MLEPEQETAALLEAQGHNRRQIAEVIHRTDRTISNWRKTEEYMARVRQLQEFGTQHLEAMIVRAREKLVESVEIVVAELVETAQTAVDSDGHPAYHHRLDASREILAHAQKVGLTLAPVVLPKASEGEAPGTAVLVVRDERPLRFSSEEG